MSFPRMLVIMGAGGFAKELLQWAIMDGYTVAALYSEQIKEPSIRGYPIVNDLRPFQGMSFLVGVGHPGAREKLWEVGKMNGLYPGEPLVAPLVVLGASRIHRGAIICPGSVVTTDAEIGSNVLININATVGHDTRIERHSVVGPGANISGNVTIREGSYVGTAASIREKIHVGKRATIGMGAIILKDVAEGTTVVNDSKTRVLAPKGQSDTLTMLSNVTPLNPNGDSL